MHTHTLTAAMPINKPPPRYLEIEKRKMGEYSTNMYGVSSTQSMGHQSKRGKSHEECLSENSNMASLGICTGSHARRSSSKRGQQQAAKPNHYTSTAEPS